MSRSPCPFCGRTDSPFSREHYLAEWIVKEFPAHYHPDSKWDVTQSEYPFDDDIPRWTRNFQRHRDLGAISKGPCERCNNRWMSDLENRVRPILSPMMHGQSVTLSVQDQRTIKRWLLKTAMTLDLTHGKEHQPYFSGAERHAVMQSRAMPLHHTAIFLAKYIGNLSVSTRDYHLRYKIDDPDAEGNFDCEGYTATLLIKQLAMQLFCIRWPKGPRRLAFRFPFNWTDATVQITPADSAAVWPPIYHLDDASLVIFTRRWDNVGLGFNPE